MKHLILFLAALAVCLSTIAEEINVMQPPYNVSPQIASNMPDESINSDGCRKL